MKYRKWLRSVLSAKRRRVEAAQERVLQMAVAYGKAQRDCNNFKSGDKGYGGGDSAGKAERERLEQERVQAEELLGRAGTGYNNLTEACRAYFEETEEL